MALDAGDFLACVIPFFPGGIGVFDTLCIDNNEARFRRPTIADTHLSRSARKELASIYVQLAAVDASYATGQVYGAAGGNGQP